MNLNHGCILYASEKTLNKSRRMSEKTKIARMSEKTEIAERNEVIA